jgi:RNA polymerase sigma-B factor
VAIIDHPREDARRRFAPWGATGDLARRNALVEEHMWLASYCANRFTRKGEPRDDLRQVALLGLVNAADRFDPARGLAFSTFAVPTILGELRRHFRDRTWSVRVNRRVKDAGRTVSLVVDDLTATLGRSPTVPEIAERAGLSTEDVLEALEANTLRLSASLDVDGPERPDSDAALGVEDPGYGAAEARTIVHELLHALPTPRDRQVVKLRFVDGLSQSEIASQVGVSQVQVSRLLRTNLARMRRAADRRRARPAHQATAPGSRAGS